MRINVKGFLTIQKAMEDQPLVAIETESVTLRTLLGELCNRYGKAFSDLIFDPGTNQLMDHNQILINGTYYRFFPEGMDTKLRDGDTVLLIPPVAGG
jgi:MoaD family protein